RDRPAERAARPASLPGLPWALSAHLVRPEGIPGRRTQGEPAAPRGERGPVRLDGCAWALIAEGKLYLSRQRAVGEWARCAKRPVRRAAARRGRPRCRRSRRSRTRVRAVRPGFDLSPADRSTCSCQPLFLRPTGLADGLAPKECATTTADSPLGQLRAPDLGSPARAGVKRRN